MFSNQQDDDKIIEKMDKGWNVSWKSTKSQDMCWQRSSTPGIQKCKIMFLIHHIDRDKRARYTPDNVESVWKLAPF